MVRKPLAHHKRTRKERIRPLIAHVKNTLRLGVDLAGPGQRCNGKLVSEITGFLTDVINDLFAWPQTLAPKVGL